MNKYSDSIINQRFNVIYSVLNDAKKFQTKSEFAENLGTYCHVIVQIERGEKTLTKDMIYNLIQHYHINANFIFGRSDKMYIKTKKTTLPKISDKIILPNLDLISLDVRYYRCQQIFNFIKKKYKLDYEICRNAAMLALGFTHKGTFSRVLHLKIDNTAIKAYCELGYWQLDQIWCDMYIKMIEKKSENDQSDQKLDSGKSEVGYIVP